MATAEALQCHAPAERAAQPMRSPSPAATESVRERQQHGSDESGNVEKDVRRHSCQSREARARSRLWPRYFASSSLRPAVCQPASLRMHQLTDTSLRCVAPAPIVSRSIEHKRHGFSESRRMGDGDVTSCMESVERRESTGLMSAAVNVHIGAAVQSATQPPRDRSAAHPPRDAANVPLAAAATSVIRAPVVMATTYVSAPAPARLPRATAERAHRRCHDVPGREREAGAPRRKQSAT
jgi:hypothetical protein